MNKDIVWAQTIVQLWEMEDEEFKRTIIKDERFTHTFNHSCNQASHGHTALRRLRLFQVKPGNQNEWDGISGDAVRKVDVVTFDRF